MLLFSVWGVFWRGLFSFFKLVASKTNYSLSTLNKKRERSAPLTPTLPPRQRFLLSLLCCSLLSSYMEKCNNCLFLKKKN